MKSRRLSFLSALLALAAPLALPAQSVQYGNLNVVQANANNGAGDITLTSAPGGTAGYTLRLPSSNRGDYALAFGNPVDREAGILVSNVAQNGRNDQANGNTFATFYATTATAYDANGYWIALFRAAQGDEINMNVSFGFFPYTMYLAGLATNGSESNDALNNTVITSVTGTDGIRVGTGLEFSEGAGAGQSILNLTAQGGSSTSGILLVSGGKNEDNYALSRANADGTFGIFVHDNGVNGGSYEADPVAFVYLPLSRVGANGLVALGRIRSGTTSAVGGGTYSVAKGGTGQWYLTIPGHSPDTGVLLVSPEGGGTNNFDNVVSAQWDAANTRWVIESRDLSGDTALPTLQNGVDANEIMFSFAFFTKNLTNALPTVALTGPASVPEGSPLQLTATASDTDGTIAKVEFFEGVRKLGESTVAPYTLDLPTVAIGAHIYTAVATDSTGNKASSARLTVAVSAPAGADGLYFDGVNDYVTFGNNPALGLKAFTLEAWIRRDGAGIVSSSGSGGASGVPLITKGRGESDGGTQDCNYFFAVNAAGRLVADFEDYATGLNHPITGTTVLPLGQWLHVAVTFDDDACEWRLYVNGALDGTVSTDDQIPRYDSVQHAGLGTAMTTTGAREGAFHGLMDEARIWNYPRTQFQIQQAINLQITNEAGLVARWGMTEGAGTTITSSADGAIVGTLGNGTLWSAGAPFDLNVKPSAEITSPETGTALVSPANFAVTVAALDGDGSVAQVELFRDGASIATFTAEPYTYQETNLSAGSYTYTAQATDNLGAVSTSTPVTVNVAFDPLHPPANTALRFDGVDDYVTMGVAPELGVGGPPTNGMTIEGWFRREGAGITSGSGSGGVTGVPLFGKGRGEDDGSTIDCNYFFGIDAAGRLVADFETYPATGLSSGQNYPVIGTNAPIQNNVWYHAAVTYDGPTATWKLYLNGQQVGQATAAAGARPRFDSIQHFGIATAMNSGGVREGAFCGRIDEVRVWNYVRSGAEILAARDTEIATAPGLVGRYGLNEALGTTVNNSVSVNGGPIGTIMGNPFWVAGAPFSVENDRPTVALTAPAPGDSTVYPAAFTFAADAADANGALARVEFFVNGERVGQDTTAPFTFEWTPAAVGTYAVIARAVDDLGSTDTSAPVELVVRPNPNQAPIATPVSPAQNATDIGSSTSLSIAINDPEGDATTVTFYGRKTVPAAPGADFTLIAIPDTQYYSENTPNSRFQQFLDQTNWIVGQRDIRNIAFVSHMGDIVDDGDSIPQQWVNANQAMSILENHATTFRAYGIPYGAAPGNHDQSTNGNPESVSMYYNQYFGVTRFAGRTYYGGNYGTNNDNNYQLFSASGLDFIAIHLEYRTAADPAVIAWADALLKAYPHRRAIVTSHWIVGQGNPAPFGGQGRQIYDGLKNNPNLFLLLCGHIHAEGRRSDVFEGRTVYSILQDYQGTSTGGSGFLRIYTFSPATNQIRVESYSPTLGRAVNSSDGIPGFGGTFTLPYNMQESVSPWVPLGTVTVPAGGTVAELNWTGLEKASNYEWKAEVSDGINVATSAPSRFSTAAAFTPTVALTSPLNGVTYTAPATLTLNASASDLDSGVARVDFFQGLTKVGTDTSAPYSLNTAALAAGSYTFSAVAVDLEGRATLSNIVTLTVATRTNVPPVVALTAPAAGIVSGSVTVSADASDTAGAVTKVAFYANGALIGEDTTAPYAVTWLALTPGLTPIMAVATDNDGATTTSAPVDVTVSFSPETAQLDLDGDGIPALIEHGLGTPPGTANRAGLPVLGVDAGKLTLTFKRAQAGLTYTVQATDDLKAWTDLATNPGTPGADVTVVDTNTTSPNRYLRLRISDGTTALFTVPAGRLSYVLAANQEAPVGFPLHQPIGAIDGRPAFFITGVGTTTMESVGAGWTAGQLSQAATPYLVRITTGVAAGRTFAVNTSIANGSDQLPLVTGGIDLTTLGIVPNSDKFELVPADTLATLFPTGTLLSGANASGDTLRLWDGATWVTFFHDGAHWQRVGGGEADNTLVLPDQGWGIRRRTPAKTVVLYGQVPSTSAQAPVVRGASTYVSLLPVQETFAEFQLQAKLPNWSSNPASVTTGDYVAIWSGTAWINYYYNGAKWMRQGAGDASTQVLLKPGRPIFIHRPAAGTGVDTVQQVKTY